MRCELTLAALLTFSACSVGPSSDEAGNDGAVDASTASVRVHYLEVVTPDVASTCALLAAQHGVLFSEPVPGLGFARTAELAGGGRIAVRAPLRDDEAPVTRPYLRVDDIDKQMTAVEASGAVVAIPPTEIPGEGRFALFILGGIEHGIWQP